MSNRLNKENREAYEKLEKENAELKAIIAKQAECISFYTQEEINYHNYHKTMDTDLTLAARKCQAEVEEMRKSYE